MALLFTRASSQHLYANISNISSRTPMTFMAWVKRADTTNVHAITCIGDSGSDLSFQALQTRNTNVRGIAFVPYAAAQYDVTQDTTTYHHLVAVFTGSNIYMYMDGTLQATATWAPSTITLNQISVGRTVTNTADYYDYANGYIEHVAIWTVALTATEISNLYNRTATPAGTQPSYLYSYTPLQSNMTPENGSLTWTPVNLSSPTYENSGISYSTCTVTYNGNSNTSGTAPTDSNSPYSTGSTVTVLTNSGSLARTNYTFNGWNTSADGTGTHYATGATFSISSNTTLYAEWSAVYQYRTINHLNFNPSRFTLAEIVYARTLKVYFEHASTGQDIFGNSTTDSSDGLNYDLSADCGLKLLYAENNRYLCSRDHAESANDYTWFSTHTGLQTNRRGNPTPANKISGFTGMSANMRGAINVAMWKYCWIDVWPETTGYISDGAAAATSDISAIETFESANPSITVVWWTMPLQSNASYAAREAYNSAIRTYCLNNGKWLFDIAALECHNDAGTKQVDGNGREIATSSYVIADGGHLSATGRTKMARAYWVLIASIANDNGSATYRVTGNTYNKSGGALGSCTVSLFKHSGSGVFSYVTTGTSNATTGAYSLIAPDNDASYMVVAFKDDTPHVFDVSDHNLQPVFTAP